MPARVDRFPHARSRPWKVRALRWIILGEQTRSILASAEGIAFVAYYVGLVSSNETAEATAVIRVTELRMRKKGSMVSSFTLKAHNADCCCCGGGW